MDQRRTLLIGPVLSALLLICAGLVVDSFPAMAAPPAATTSASAVVTDQAQLTVSDKFAMPPSQVRLTDAGDVLFTSQALSSLFRWDGTTRTRLLQMNDAMPGYPRGLVNAAGANLQVNSLGHASMVLAWVQKGMNFPGGVFVFDGSKYQKVAVMGDPAPGTGKPFASFGATLINASDQVAFVGFFGAAALSQTGIFRGKPGEAPMKVALIGESAPGTPGTFDGFSIRGLTAAGDVVFFAFVTESPMIRYGAIFYWSSGGGVSLIAKLGDPAPGTVGGTLGNLTGGGTLANGNGNVAFVSNINGAGATNRGIWVWDGATINPLVLNTDSTPLGGAYGGNIQLRGFNNSGRALFSSNVSGPGHALFVDDAGNPAEVVFYRGQSLPGGATGTFFGTQQAALNNSGAVAFLAALSGGAPGPGWFLWTGGTPSKIVLQGESLLGLTVGLAGRSGAPFAFQLNGGNKLVLTADILGPDITAVLYWDGSSLVRIVGSDDLLPAGANLIIRTPNGPRASDDELLFQAFRTGGALAYFTTRLQGALKIRRVAGEGDLAPDGGTIVNLGEAWINGSETVSVLAGAVVHGGGLYPRSAIYISKPRTALQKLVASGDAAPTPIVGTYSGFQSHRLNNNDQVAFFAFLSDPAKPQGIFLASLANPAQTVVAVNDPAPLAGTLFQNLQPQGSGRVAINDNGLVVFDAVLRPTPGPGPDLYGLFAWSSTNPIEKIVLDGESLGPGSTFADAFLPAIFKVSNNGYLAYNGLTYEGGDGVHLWRGPGSGLPVILAQTGTPAPGSPGADFSIINGNTIDINNSGKVAFAAWLTEATGRETAGYFLYDGTNVLARLREGDALPGGGAAGPAVASLALNEAGEVAMAVPDVTGAPNFFRYVIADASGNLRAFARVDDTAPDTGSSFGRLFTPPTANSSGQFFFTSALVGKNAKSGVFVSTPAKP